MPPPVGASRVALFSFAEGLPSACRHAVATTPAGSRMARRSAGLTRLVHHDVSLPRLWSGSAPALLFSRLARRSLALRPVCSPNHQM